MMNGRHYWPLVAGALVAAIAAASLPARAEPPADAPLLEQARRADPKRYEYAEKEGARVVWTADRRSFYLLWYPPGVRAESRPPMIATLHGHGSWAFDEFFLWHRFAKERGFGIVALQWWLGQGERSQDYLAPNEIYRVFDDAFRAEKISPGSVLFHGFSRGAANSYPVVAFDRDTGNGYFALCIANAGMPGPDFPPNVEIERGRFGATPLAGSHWFLYAGAKDAHPERDGIEGMRAARRWIERFGGVVDVALEDPDGDHGGFHRNPKNVNAALDQFEKRLGRRK